MKKLSLVKWVPRKPYLALTICALVLLTLLYFAGFARKVNHVDYYRVNNDDTKFFLELRKIFPKTEFFTVTFTADDIFSNENLKLIKSLSDHIAEIPEVISVTSLSTVDSFEGKEGKLDLSGLIKDKVYTEEELSSLKAKTISNRLYSPNLAAKNGKAASIIIFAKERPEDDRYRQKLIDKVDTVLKQYSGKVAYFYKAGWTVTNVELSKLLQEDLLKFVPLTYLLILFTVFFLYRNTRLTLLVAINLSATCLSIVGLFGLTGITVNNLTAIAIPLGLTLCLADTIHIISYLSKDRLKPGTPPVEALAEILSQVVKPCFFTSLLTAIGFASLSMSSIVAMKDFALIASLAMTFEFFYSFYLLPALMALSKPEKIFTISSEDSKDRFRLLLERWFSFINKNSIAIIIASLLISLTAIFFLLKVPVETNVVNFFKEKSRLRQDLKFVEENVGGVSTFDVALVSNQEDTFKNPENLKYIEKISDYLKAEKGIDSVISAAEVFKQLNRAFNSGDESFYSLPTSVDAVEQFLVFYSGKDLNNVITADYSKSRIIVRMSLHSSREQQTLLDNLRGFILNNPPPAGIEVRPAGYAVNYTNMAKEMVNSQINSFGTALIVIGIVMILLLRNLKLGLLSLVPNIFPVILVFGIMGIFKIPLDAGTIMIASVSLGIACDDTVHFLFLYQELLKQGLNSTQALKEVIMQKGRAILSTTLVLSIGFSVLIFGDFLPVFYFGLLSSLTMILAVFGDLMLLPAIILAKQALRKA